MEWLRLSRNDKSVESFTVTESVREQSELLKRWSRRRSAPWILCRMKLKFRTSSSAAEEIEMKLVSLVLLDESNKLPLAAITYSHSSAMRCRSAPSADDDGEEVFGCEGN